MKKFPKLNLSEHCAMQNPTRSVVKRAMEMLCGRELQLETPLLFHAPLTQQVQSTTLLPTPKTDLIKRTSNICQWYSLP